MIEIWGVEGVTPAAPPPELEDRRPDAHLMHGPATDGGPSQADVDALFERLGQATEAAAAAPAPVPVPVPAPAAAAPTGEKSSQSQIDAMFN
jgi:hypothetical protein